MIKTEDFVNVKVIEPELAALLRLLDVVRAKMYRKLLQKWGKGFKGWDDPKFLPVLKQKLREHIDRGFDPENMIDVMNLAAMIWNQEQS